MTCRKRRGLLQPQLEQAISIKSTRRCQYVIVRISGMLYRIHGVKAQRAKFILDKQFHLLFTVHNTQLYNIRNSSVNIVKDASLEKSKTKEYHFHMPNAVV